MIYQTAKRQNSCKRWIHISEACFNAVLQCTKSNFIHYYKCTVTKNLPLSLYSAFVGVFVTSKMSVNFVNNCTENRQNFVKLQYTVNMDESGVAIGNHKYEAVLQVIILYIYHQIHILFAHMSVQNP